MQMQFSFLDFLSLFDSLVLWASMSYSSALKMRKQNNLSSAEESKQYSNVITKLDTMWRDTSQEESTYDTWHSASLRQSAVKFQPHSSQKACMTGSNYGSQKTIKFCMYAYNQRFSRNVLLMVLVSVGIALVSKATINRAGLWTVTSN